MEATRTLPPTAGESYYYRMSDPKHTQHTNRLAGESSPYLRQHAHNPVDWYPWGEEALTAARVADRPILLSVGYSACHWCHVMERESFEDERIAQRMNEHFINIKVDREERPDVDEIYMTAVQAMTGQGGWPMTVFLTPDLQPFYGGTYFPPEDRHGRPGFPRVLQAIADYYRENRAGVAEKTAELMRVLQQHAEFLTPGDIPGEAVLDQACAQLKSTYDSRHGGFGGAPKFPPSMSLSLLLRRYARRGDQRALAMAEHTLKRMARGGMYDQLGGGFHRYSVDERWLVPHFEKMLYDNALLVWIYIEAYQATQDEFYRTVVEHTLGYVLREMTQPEGGFYAAQDADSEGEEGRFFTWLLEEIEDLLGEQDAALFARYYGVVPEGNFEHGRNILHVENELAGVARLLGVSPERLARVVERGRAVLLAARQHRVAPGRDDKILTAWNGLMISAMARAYQVIGAERYLRAAAAAADFILERMVCEGRLLHTYKDGRAQILAYQDDYASVVNGLLDLYEASFERRFLAAAEHWAAEMVARFWDGERGGFFYAGAEATDLIVRTKNPFDNATPSGNSLGALVLLRLGAMTGDRAWGQRGEQTLVLFEQLLRRAPAAGAQMLCALDFYWARPAEVALVGNRAECRAFAAALHRCFLPNKVVLAAAVGEEEAAAALPLLKGKLAVGGRAYVCRDATCSRPLSTVADLVEQLRAEQ